MINCLQFTNFNIPSDFQGLCPITVLTLYSHFIITPNISSKWFLFNLISYAWQPSRLGLRPHHSPPPPQLQASTSLSTACGFVSPSLVTPGEELRGSPPPSHLLIVVHRFLCLGLTCFIIVFQCVPKPKIYKFNAEYSVEIRDITCKL